jgi:hypothetical protein
MQYAILLKALRQRTKSGIQYCYGMLTPRPHVLNPDYS